MEKKILDLELADSKNANEFSNSVRVLPAHWAANVGVESSGHQADGNSFARFLFYK